LLTARSKLISMRALPSPPGKAKAHGGCSPKGLDVDRICSFGYHATVGNDNAVRLEGILLDIPAAARRGHGRYCPRHPSLPEMAQLIWSICGIPRKRNPCSHDCARHGFGFVSFGF
jgi:hypothetical protein